MTRRRHGSAVILLGGWLLMEPPLIEDAQSVGGYRVEVSAPVSNWRQESAHDTAHSCQSARATNLMETIKLAKAARGKKDVSEEPLVKSGFQSRCVPAEYIYPPKQPTSK